MDQSDWWSHRGRTFHIGASTHTDTRTAETVGSDPKTHHTKTPTGQTHDKTQGEREENKKQKKTKEKKKKETEVEEGM